MITTSPRIWKAILSARRVLVFASAIAAAALIAFPRTAQADGRREHDGWHRGRVERRWDHERERWEHRRWGWRYRAVRPYRGCYYWTPLGYRYDWDCDVW